MRNKLPKIHQLHKGITGPSATRPDQEAICAGLGKARNRHDLRGVKAAAGADHDGIRDNGASSVVVIDYPDQNQNLDNLYWTFTKLGNDNCNDLPEQNECFLSTAGGATGRSNLLDAPQPALATMETFDLQAIAPGGAAPDFLPTFPAWNHQLDHLR